MKLLYIFILKLSLLHLCSFSSNTEAKDILIGATLNLSGVNALHSLDFKNAIEAYIESYNQLDKLKKYKLKLLVLDDQGIESRAIDNIERLITRKNVIAIVNPYQGKIGDGIIKIASNLKTLVLSSTFATKEITTKLNNRYSYYFSTLNYFSHKVVRQLFDQLSVSNQNLFYLIDETTVGGITTLGKPTEIIKDKPIIDLPQNAAIIIKENHVEAAFFINKVYSARPDFSFIILPNIGADTLLILLDKKAIKNIHFIVDIPVHLQPPLYEESINVFKKHNKGIMINTQSLKGILAAKIITESIFNVVNTLHTDSLVDVVTLPFKVLKRMLGWVKNSTNSLDRELIIDEIRNLESFEVGLEETINYKKNGLGLSRLWLLEIGQGKLVPRVNK